jgi:hypothetical protein
MRRVFPRVVILTCVVSAFAVGVAVLIGCGGVSPFAAARFAGLITPTEQTGGGGSSTQPAQPTTGAIASVCDIDAALRVISVTIANASAQFLQFSMTFAVSAGTGGFVCDTEVQNYTQAGYTDALIPGSGNTITVGCDTLTLLSGNRLLTLEFGVNQGIAATLGPAENPESANPTPTTFQLVRRDNGSPLIPLPELIVLGNSNVNFLCTGQNLCTQVGFLYTSTVGIPVGKPAEVSRIQGTVCQTGFGTAPEWRLDKTVFEGTPSAFQYAAGGAIIATALNRANDSLTDTRKQVVWLVTDSNGQTIHFPAP